MDLAGKRILITGSTDGLGKLLALNLAKLGADLVIHGRDKVKLDHTREELIEVNESINVDQVLCDLNQPEEISNAFSSIDRLDILINNAGVWAEGDTVDISAERIIELTNVNLLAPLLITRQLLTVLKKSDFAQILNVSSIAGVEIPQDYSHTIYSANKFGVQAFSEALAKEFGNSNLRVMGYYPGGMDTNFFAKVGIDYEKSEPWMFDPQESVDAMVFMLTRNKKVNVKRLDLINHLEV